MNEIIRCKECKRPITEDNIENTFSLCYECFRRLKSNQMSKGSGCRCFGCIVLIIVLITIISLATLLEFEDPRKTATFIYGSIFACIFPMMCIISGYSRERKWKKIDSELK